MIVAEPLGQADIRMGEERDGHLCQTAKRYLIRSRSPMQGLGGARFGAPVAVPAKEKAKVKAVKKGQ